MGRPARTGPRTRTRSRYVVAATGTAGLEDPVLLPVAGWDPHGPDGLEEWVVERVCQDYPQVTADAVRRLVRQRRVIPVLDGLDEMPAPVRDGALARLEEAAGAGLRMVLTCRGEEFEQAVAEVGALPQAAVVEVEPVRVADAVEYLTQREAVGSSRWDRVTEAMTADPDGPLASALSTPLMVSLVRQVFRKPGTDPRELAEVSTARAVQQRLLEGFLPSAFGSQQAGENAGRWLSFLVTHLPTHPGDPNLQWWRLGRAVPRLVIITLVTAAVTVLGVLVGITTATVASGDVLGGIGVGAVLGVVVGLIGGRQVARSARVADSTPRRPVWLSVIVSGTADFVAAAATVSVLGAATLLVVSVVAAPAAVSVSMDVVDTATGFHRIQNDDDVLLGVFLGVTAVVLARGLGAGRSGVPARAGRCCGGFRVPC